MSRCYRIRQTVRVRDSLSRDVSACDEICTELELIEVLPREQMAELLRGSLEGRGFRRDEDGTLSRSADGIAVRVDPAGGEVTVRIASSDSIEVEGTKEVAVAGPATEAQREQLREKLRQELEEKAGRKEEELRRRVSEELEAALGGLSEELERVVNEVTREALKRKAAQVGDIKEISEDPEAGSLTIKVEV